VPRPRLCLIAAVARDGGLGHRGALLVHVPGDLPRFKRLTLGAPMVMGRKTWDSIGRPLPGRTSIVVTRDRSWRAEGALAAPGLDEALAIAGDVPVVNVVGGAEIYALALPGADVLELTEIDAVFPADAFFPPWPREAFREAASEAHGAPDGLRWRYVRYERIAAG